MTSEDRPLLYVVDDDAAVVRGLARLLRSSGYEVETFGSAQEFLSGDRPDRPSCLILDVKMPGITGLELQEKLSALNLRIPIIFITGQGNISTSVRAMKAGAVDFLEKPFDDTVLLDIVSQAIEKDLANRRINDEVEGIKKHLETLTPREREVFTLVVSGLLNKQIAYELGVTEKTVKVHRARIMQKMNATSLANLVHLAEKLA